MESIEQEIQDMQREQGGIQSAIASEESKIQVMTLLAILPLRGHAPTSRSAVTAFLVLPC